MYILWIILLGLVQGFTEFLPVSSSGHLVLIQKLIPGFIQPGVLFDVIIHLGTLIAVLIYFRKKIMTIRFKYLMLLIVGTVPAGLAGVLFGDALEKTFSVGGIFLAVQFLITSLFCFFTDSLKDSNTKKEISLPDSIYIGIAQAAAIIPAISRSGATIFAGKRLGIDKEKAAEFSFLMSVPAILGANVLEIFKYRHDLASVSGAYFLGFLAALIMGLLSINITLSYLKKNNFKVFGFYTLVLVVVSLFVR